MSTRDSGEERETLTYHLDQVHAEGLCGDGNRSDDGIMTENRRPRIRDDAATDDRVAVASLTRPMPGLTGPNPVSPHYFKVQQVRLQILVTRSRRL